MSAAPKLALTPGEPAGIGPDLAIQLAQEALPAELVAFANPELLQARARQLGLPLTLIPHDPARPARLPNAGELTIAPLPLRAPCEAGRLDPANGEYVLDTLRAAARACLSGELAGLVTGPVHKGVINEAAKTIPGFRPSGDAARPNAAPGSVVGVPFTGHTEFLAELSGGYPVMMLATGHLRVALATTHLPLRNVADAIDQPLLEQVCRILDHDLRTRFGITRPRILVAGLNPHAGEGGHLGREEIDVIEPVLERLRAEGLDLIGPLPADTLFTRDRLQGADAVLAMYHDQGLPVLKYAGFGEAVNITLGLPLLRTSVDHGTALELAGSGRAKVDSLRQAVLMAHTMASTQAPTSLAPSPAGRGLG